MNLEKAKELFYSQKETEYFGVVGTVCAINTLDWWFEIYNKEDKGISRFPLTK